MDIEGLIARASRDRAPDYTAEDQPWAQALHRFAENYDRAAGTTEAGRTATTRLAAAHIDARRAIEDWHERNPSARDAAIDRPLFILGMPRAGTTMLLNLLRHDRNRRVYWNWEANRELPPARIDSLDSDPRVALRVDEIEAGIASGVLDPRHHLERGDEPTECFWPLARDFKSYTWLVQAQVPEFFDWMLNEADMVPAYRHHKETLQLMQSGLPGRWTLKMPSHAAWIDALLTVYPDARVVFCHRDPIKPVASVCNMVRHILINNRAGCDLNYLAHETSELILASANRMVGALDAYPHVPFHDLHYKRFVADPMATIHAMYDWLGELLPADAEARMMAELDRHNQERAVHGAHLYDLGEFGLSRAALAARFAGYMDRFGIQAEKD